MRTLLLGILFFCSAGFTTDFVHNIPNGHFAGLGLWSDSEGKSGEYATYVELRDNDMRVDYNWGDQTLTLFLSFWFDEPGHFQVFHRGNVIGSGSCITDQCHYDVNADDMYYSETLQFGYDHDGKPTLSKVGQKQIGNRLVGWQDGLYYVNLDGADPVVLPVPAE